MRWLPLPMVLLSGLVLAADKPVPVDQAAARMTVPPGFHVTLFAGEPQVVQPIAFTFDDRGRMWVVECLSYPNWRADGKGSDRVVILEDTDGDGKADKRTVVLDNGCNLSGIELGFGGMYLCSTPNLLFVPLAGDTPSGPPVVLLDGWNLKEAKHNAFNGLAWGPDGWLYGTNGIQTKSWVGAPGTSKEQRTYLDCGVWRFHPTRKTFDVFAHGTTNPWGVDWDEHGELVVTNCVIDHLFHFVPGGHYKRMHGQDANPFSYALMGPASEHKHWGAGHWTDARPKVGEAVGKALSDLGGGHAHSGVCVYLGDQFPAEYRNTVFMCNIHGNRLNNDGLVRTPTGLKGVRRPDFLFANDPWFRGVAVKQGPDGSLYVADWSDTGECHNYDKADASSGRIVKVSYGTPKPWTTDVAKLSDEELWNTHRGKNEWLTRRARLKLQERGNGEPPGGLFGVLHAANELTELNVWRTMHAVGKLKPEVYDVPPSHPESIRVSVVRAGTDAALSDTAFHRRLIGWALDDSVLIRVAVAGAVRKLPSAEALPLAIVLCGRTDTPRDLALLIWYGVQPHVAADPDGAAKLAVWSKVPLIRQFVARHLIDMPAGDEPAKLARVVKLLGAVGDEAARLDVLRGAREALAGRRNVPAPAGWDTTYIALAAASPEVRGLADELALTFGDKRAIKTLLTYAVETKTPVAEREAAIRRLAEAKVEGVTPHLHTLLADPAVRGAAVRALAAVPAADTPAVVLAKYRDFTPAEKADAVQTLAARPASALALLDAVATGTVAKSDITAFAARQIQALNDKAVSAKLAGVWGTVKAASGDRAARIAAYKAKLQPESLAAADLPLGKQVFARQCGTCHKLHGDGGEVGPELTGAQRGSLDYLLENVLDPNAVVAYDYKMTAFALADGRTLTGIVRRETPTAVVVRTVNDEVTVPKADIDKRTPTDLSVMPEGLFDQLSDAELRAVVAYLMK